MHFLFALGFLAVGIGVGVWVWTNQQKAKAAMAWPKTTGVVTMSQVNEQRSLRTAGESVGDNISYSPVVHYDYEVAGTKYSGAHIGFGSASFRTRGGAQKALAAYPLGATIQVLVDPADPKNAVLTPKVAINMFLPIIFVAVGVVLLFINF